MSVINDNDFSLVKINIRDHLSKVDTIGKIFLSKLYSYPDKTFLKYKKYGSFRNISYKETYNSIKALYNQFCNMNLKKGDKILFISPNRQQLLTASLCTSMSGFVSVIITPHYTENQINEVINDVKPQCIIISQDEQFEKIPKNIPVISFDKISGEVLYYKDIIKKYKNTEINFENIIFDVNPQDIACILYQYSKNETLEGIKLTHQNIISSIKNAYEETNTANSSDTVLLAHPFDLIGGLFDFYLCLYAGAICALTENNEIQDILNNIIESKSNILSATARIWKNFHNHFQLDNNPLLKQEFIDSVCQNLHQGTCHGLIQENSITEFFELSGIKITQFYSFPETSGPIAYKKTYNDSFKLLNGIEVTIEKNSEITIKGKNIINSNSFKTGFSGKIDENNNLIILNNKSNCINNLEGYKIYPKRIENLVQSDFIYQFVVIGSQKEFLSALIVPNKEYLIKYAVKELKINNKTIDELIKNRWVKALYHIIIENLNKNLADFEQIKKFILVSESFTVESMEITLSGDFDRDYIEINRSKEFDKIYKVSFSKLFYM